MEIFTFFTKKKIEIWFRHFLFFILINIARFPGWIILIISLCAIAKLNHHKMKIITAFPPRCHFNLCLMQTFSNFGQSLALQPRYTASLPRSRPRRTSPPTPRALLISIITSPWYCYTGIHRARAATGGNAPGRADGSHSGGSEEENRWRTDGVCVHVGSGICWVSAGVGGKKSRGRGPASDRQVSWQAHGLLITQGLPAPLGAVSNMSEHNQPETATIHHKLSLCVCVCVCISVAR